MSAHGREPDADDDIDKEPLPRSLKVFLTILAAIVLVVVIAHLMGIGLGGHG